MADRSRRRRARHALRVVLLTVVIFVLWRFLGPSLAVVRDGSLAPILEDGDIVWITPVRGDVALGAVVLVDPFLANPTGIRTGLNPFNTDSEDEEHGSDTPAREGTAVSTPRPDRLVPRIVVGFSGDVVTWTDTSVSVVPSDGNRFQLSPEPLHPLLRQKERSLTVPDDSFFTVSLSGGIIDSRLIGARPERVVHYEVSRIIWPRERRGAIDRVESGHSASP